MQINPTCNPRNLRSASLYKKLPFKSLQQSANIKLKSYSVIYSFTTHILIIANIWSLCWSKFILLTEATPLCRWSCYIYFTKFKAALAEVFLTFPTWICGNRSHAQSEMFNDTGILNRQRSKSRETESYPHRSGPTAGASLCACRPKPSRHRLRSFLSSLLTFVSTSPR